ncbi:hypothetical protein AK812_SmicGene22566 [Symbiodinium microadriaticum]|uniref:Uncharacterized protein n=1 Tax=Symbiodinium microadriaticum TaxID=2951 RepID=A0A1Q9DJI2_SYMMI|nr:hypothetical protein AK812_SmicGene22566 [Symbiodinium microadriaticum]CAE7869337.1 unnamed protein product [Symbiodinium sp. KB8]
MASTMLAVVFGLVHIASALRDSEAGALSLDLEQAVTVSTPPMEADEDEANLMGEHFLVLVGDDVRGEYKTLQDARSELFKDLGDWRSMQRGVIWSVHNGVVWNEAVGILDQTDKEIIWSSLEAARKYEDEKASKLWKHEADPERRLAAWRRTPRARGPCSFWNAEYKDGSCECPEGRNAHGPWSTDLSSRCLFTAKIFNVSSVAGKVSELWSPSCSCVGTKLGLFVTRNLPPEQTENVTALQFCTHLLASAHPYTHTLQAYVEVDQKLDEKLCEQALTDTSKVQEILGKAGHAFQHVCRDECQELVKTMREWAEPMMKNYRKHKYPLAAMCTQHVIKHVESHELGCCARSCGWNGKTCLHWPLLWPDDQEDWKAECCSERNIVVGSEREIMCRSVLPALMAKTFRELDLKPKGQNLASYVGEDEEVVWTRKGADSLLGEPAWAEEGQVVDDSFLRWQPLSFQEGLELELWKIKKSETSQPSQSVLQMKGTDCAQTTSLMETCPEHTLRVTQEACAKQAGLKYIFKNKVEDGACTLLGNESVDSAAKCFQHEFQGSPGSETMIARLFGYERLERDATITCYFINKACVDEDEEGEEKEMQMKLFTDDDKNCISSLESIYFYKDV